LGRLGVPLENLQCLVIILWGSELDELGILIDDDRMVGRGI
jgi:hypothetical protein